MKVLVTGGRDYHNKAHVFRVLDEIHARNEGIELIIQGGATGADQLASDWAKLREIPCLRHPAKWRTGTRMAGEGPIRNKAMLKWEPDLVAAFPGNNGTANMVALAENANVPIRDERNFE